MTSVYTLSVGCLYNVSGVSTNTPYVRVGENSREETTLNPAPPPKKQANLAAKKEKAHELQEAAAEEHKKALADYKKAQV